MNLDGLEIHWENKQKKNFTVLRFCNNNNVVWKFSDLVEKYVFIILFVFYKNYFELLSVTSYICFI